MPSESVEHNLQDIIKSVVSIMHVIGMQGSPTSIHVLFLRRVLRAPPLSTGRGRRPIHARMSFAKQRVLNVAQ